MVGLLLQVPFEALLPPGLPAPNSGGRRSRTGDSQPLHTNLTTFAVLDGDHVWVSNNMQRHHVQTSRAGMHVARHVMGW